MPWRAPWALALLATADPRLRREELLPRAAAFQVHWLPAGQPARRAMRHPAPRLEGGTEDAENAGSTTRSEGGRETEAVEADAAPVVQLSAPESARKQTEEAFASGVSIVEELRDKLKTERSNWPLSEGATMWLSVPWIEKAQERLTNMRSVFQKELQTAQDSASEAQRSAEKATAAAAAASAAKVQLESAVRDAEAEVERARQERADACERAEEFEAQVASTTARLERTEEQLESTKADLEEACSVARVTVSTLDDALEGAQDKLTKVQRALDDKTTEADKLQRAAEKAAAEVERIEAAREEALAEAEQARQELLETQLAGDRERQILVEENLKLRDDAAAVSQVLKVESRKLAEAEAQNVQTTAALAKAAGENRQLREDAAAQRVKDSAAMKEVSTERDAALTRVVELEEALAEATMSKRARLRRLISRLRQRLRRK